MSSVMQTAERSRRSMVLYRRLAPYVWAEWRLLLLTMGAMLGTTAIILAQPWPLQVVVDSVLGGKPVPPWISMPLGTMSKHQLLIVATALMVVAVLVGQLMALAQNYFSALLGQRMVCKLRSDLYAKLQQVSLTFHDRSSVGDLVYRVTSGAAAVQDIVTYGFVPLAIQFVTAIIVATTIFIVDFRLGLIALASAPVLVAWTVWFSDRVRHRSRALANAEQGLYTIASETLSSIRAVKSFAMEDRELVRFEDRARSSQHAYVGVVALGSLGTLGTEAIVGLATAAVVFGGAVLVMGGSLTLGELLVFMAYLRALYAPITQLAVAALIIQRSAASVELVVQVLDQEGEHRTSRTLELLEVVGRIQFDDIFFGYDEERLALRGINLYIEPGEMVAFVGRSGAGKTTLLSLLLHFYEPKAGRILLDGVDIATVELRSLRRQVALVLQASIIFSGSIAENISYGRPGASLEEIVTASRAAGLDDFVQELPRGYDTPVGERGVFLSGGQRQRLSIARAFLKDAPILILDEPTSNLDAITEQHIFESLDRLAQGRTTLVIAHRLATAQRADRIVVIDAGQVAEHGTHAELLRFGCQYAELCRDQASLGSSRSESGLITDLDSML